MRLFQAALHTCLDSPFFANLSVHGLHFTVYAPSILQGGSGTEPEPETRTVGTVSPETESGTGTAGTVLQEPKPEPEPSFPLKNNNS